MLPSRRSPLVLVVPWRGLMVLGTLVSHFPRVFPLGHPSAFSSNQPNGGNQDMKAIIAMVACVVLSTAVVPAFANSKTIEVQKDKQGKAGQDISIRTTTIDAKLISIDEEGSFTLQAADVKD